MISFENSQWIKEQQQYAESCCPRQIRPQARHYDEYEHEIPWDFARISSGTPRAINWTV